MRVRSRIALSRVREDKLWGREAIPYHVYILASHKHGTLYVGVTNNLAERMWQHRQPNPGTFCSRYNVKQLVWSEPFDDVRDAIAHETRLKRWRREWKIELIEKSNPDWTTSTIG